MMRANGSGLVLLASLAVFATPLGCTQNEEPELSTAVCDAVNTQRFDDAIRESEGLGRADTLSGREVAECRCIAQISTGQRERCAEELDPLLSSSDAADWTPHPLIAKLVLHRWASTGRISDAADLAERVADEMATQGTEDFEVLQLELRLRSRTEDETALLESVEARLDVGGAQIPQRLALALAWLARSQNERALAVLGNAPPAVGDRLTLPWYETRIQAQAAIGDLEAVQQTFARWAETGWDPVDLAARYALRLSVGQLVDPKRDRIELLRASLAQQNQLEDQHIIWGLHRRLVTELLVSDRAEEALAAYDHALRTVELPGITRAQIERAVRGDTLLSQTESAARLRFIVPSEAVGGSLWLSPGPEEAPDIGYHRIDLADDTPVEVDTAIGLHPRRYVLRNAQSEVLGSGAVWPESNATRTVEITANAVAASGGQPKRLTSAFVDAPKPAAAKPRLFVILADCGDWRLTEYLRARDELPFQDHVLREGYRAVLKSHPAFTAAAMKSLVWPGADPSIDTLGWVHQFGLEAAGLESVGRNPLGFLSTLLPETPNLFETIGSGPIRTANMLLAHGNIETGRHAEVIGPHGLHDTLPPQNAFRALAAETIVRYPGLTFDASTKRFAETIAAEMDAALEVAEAGEVDFFFMRLEALDLMTHGHFGALDGVGQDNGQGPLLDTYRYIDDRLGELRNALDANDRLIVMSDHGIRSSMQHEEDALFAVIGGGVPHGRAAGQPDLRGIPRSLAAMLSIETEWPDTGAAPWAERVNEASSLASVTSSSGPSGGGSAHRSERRPKRVADSR